MMKKLQKNGRNSNEAKKQIFQNVKDINPNLKTYFNHVLRLEKSQPIFLNELQKHRDKKSIALFNVLLFRMSLKSIDIKISIAHCFD